MGRAQRGRGRGKAKPPSAKIKRPRVVVPERRISRPVFVSAISTRGRARGRRPEREFRRGKLGRLTGVRPAGKLKKPTRVTVTTKKGKTITVSSRSRLARRPFITGRRTKKAKARTVRKAERSRAVRFGGTLGTTRSPQSTLGRAIAERRRPTFVSSLIPFQAAPRAKPTRGEIRSRGTPAGKRATREQLGRIPAVALVAPARRIGSDFDSLNIFGESEEERRPRRSRRRGEEPPEDFGGGDFDVLNFFA